MNQDSFPSGRAIDLIRRFAFAQGTGKTMVAPAPVVDMLATTTSGQPPNTVDGEVVALPLGTHRLLSGLRYPDGRTQIEDERTRLGHLLITSFGLQRREPSNPYNDHRVAPSVRSKFPIRVFSLDRDFLRYFDHYRHALMPVGKGLVGLSGTMIVLVGRYTDLPDQYGLLRGSLVDLEIGHSLRSLLMAAELLDVPVDPCSAGPNPTIVRDVLPRGLGETWSEPVCVALGKISWLSPEAGDPVSPKQISPQPMASADSLVVLREIDRLMSQPADSRTMGGPASGAGARGLSDGLSSTACGTWADVLWERSAGRAPAGTLGFSGVRGECAREALEDAIRLAQVPSPSGRGQAVASYTRFTVLVQDVQGVAAGLYEVASDGTLLPRPGADDVTQQIDRAFGYPLSPGTDCAIRSANMIWAMSADLRGILDVFGPAGWRALQLWCGWACQGLALAAAAHRMYLRPARSFDELMVQEAMRLPHAETPVYMAITGFARFREPMLDLRT